MSHSDVKIALLIDADNAPAGKIDLILSELAKYGMVNIRRAYGNWKSTSLQSWENMLHEYAIRPIQQFDYTKGKNATDMALVIEAMDLLYTQKLDAFGIVSSDCDFTPLVMRVLTSGHRVYGFGEKKTPTPFVRACSKFTYLEALGTSEKIEALDTKAATSPAPSNFNATVPAATTTIRKTANELKGDTRLILLLRNAIDATTGDDGWAALANVGHHISNQASFDSRNYGYSKLSDLFAACDLFETTRRKGHIYVRDNRTSRKIPSQTETTPSPKSPPESHPPYIPLQEKYRLLLNKKGWKLAPKDHVQEFYSALREIPPSGSKEIIAECSKRLAESMTLVEAEAAFGIFWKAKLFEIIVPPDSQFGLKKILIFQDSPQVFHKIDEALLTKLIEACRETETIINPWKVQSLLYGDYDEQLLSDTIKSLFRSIATKA